MSTKQRLSASVDSSLIEAAEAAVKEGRSPSLNAWVNDALHLKLDHERRLESLAAFVRAYEKDHGEISPDEMSPALRRARAKAVAVRGLPEGKSVSPPRSRGAR